MGALTATGVAFTGVGYNTVGGSRFFAAGGNYNYLYTGSVGGMIWINQADTAALMTLSNAGNLSLGGSVSMGALTTSGLATFNAGASLAASYGLAIADGAPGATTNKLYNSTSQLMWNSYMVLTLGNMSTNAAVYQAAMASATAPMTGTHAQMVAYSAPAGYFPYWYATDDLNTNDSTYGALYQWGGSAWTYINQPQAFFPKVTAGVISAGAVGTNALAAGSITAASGIIADLAIGTAKIVDAAITNAKIGSLAVATAQIQDAAITNAKIGSLAVQTANIADANITTAKIGLLQVTAATIADATITTAKIGLLQVTAATIADATITTAKIGLLQVTNALIADATIASAKIAALDAAKITSGYIDAARINAGTITAGMLVSDLVMTSIIRSTGYTAGDTTTGPNGFKLSGTAFTTTYKTINGYASSSSNCFAEIGGECNIGGYKAFTMADRVFMTYNRLGSTWVDAFTPADFIVSATGGGSNTVTLSKGQTFLTLKPIPGLSTSITMDTSWEVTGSGTGVCSGYVKVYITVGGTETLVATYSSSSATVVTQAWTAQTQNIDTQVANGGAITVRIEYSATAASTISKTATVKVRSISLVI